METAIRIHRQLQYTIPRYKCTGISKTRTIRSDPTNFSFIRAATTTTIDISHQEYNVSTTAILPSQSKKGINGVVHFLGGAFAGAVPLLLYKTFLTELCSAANVAIILTPYQVTFSHQTCAMTVHELFLKSLSTLQTNQSTKYSISSPQVFGVGHSNGALLHALIGSLYSPQNASNVLISYNNRQVSDAVPLPLDPVQFALQSILQPQQGTPLTLEGIAQSALDQAATFLASTDAAFAKEGQSIEELKQLVAPAVLQLGSVFDEVAQGTKDFTPTPAENGGLIAERYAVPSTLCIRFMDDSIDQTDVLVCAIKNTAHQGGSTSISAGMERERRVDKLLLEGNHLTPVGGDLTMLSTGGDRKRKNSGFGPADAVAMALVEMSRRDLRRTARETAKFLLQNRSV